MCAKRSAWKLGIAAGILAIAMAAFLALSAAPAGQAYAKDKLITAQAGFAPNLVNVAGNRPITVQGYLNTQGTAFDTYTKADGYSFAGGTDGGKNYLLIHFKMNAAGQITQQKSLAYQEKNVGHANDATVFKYKNKKYLFVAVSDAKNLPAKASNGKSTKVAVIDLGEFAKNKTKVYACNIKVNKGVRMVNTGSALGFSGISYAGKQKVDGKTKKDVFVLKDGRTFYAAYPTFAKGQFTLNIFARGQVEKPDITYKGKKYEPAFQGLTYHNGYIYLPFSGEKNKNTYNNTLIGRIKYSTLFAKSTPSKLQTWGKRYDKDEKGSALAKCIPEAIFFRTLEGKDKMCVSYNRATTGWPPDNDMVLRSTQKF